MTHICAHPNCSEEASFPAPRDPRNIGDRQYFCEQHIKEFNKNWNGLDGFNEDEIFSMQQTATWDRPTWKAGVNAPQADQLHFKTSEELYRFFKMRHQADYQQQQGAVLPPDVKEACVIFAIDNPDLSLAKVKQRYLALVKQHHPDVNAGSQSAEEMVKRINVAYQILQDYIANK